MLKLDPKNTELLAQKQEVLNKNIKTTEDKLKKLKELKAKADEAMAKGTEINEENYRNLQREIINTQNKLSDLKNEASNWTKAGNYLTNLGNELDKISDKLNNLGNKLTTRLTLPITAGLGAGIKNAIDFETAFTGVEKTVDGTVEQMANLKQGIRDMAKEIPSSTTEISAVAEAAGQLGIQTDNILGFSKAMIDLGNSTNLTADEAASQLAKFANVMQMSQSDFDKLGSSIVDLGNNFATTEADIVSMAMRLAGAGKQVGFSEGDVLGLATALSSVGIEAEMGGSAISKAMVKMQNAVEMGGEKLNKVLEQTGVSLRDLQLMSSNKSKNFKALAQSIGMTSTELNQLIKSGAELEDFAQISGMTAEEFKKAWQEDASGALTQFIKGLGNAEEKGESAIGMLTEMGLTEVRLRDSLLRAANAGDLLNNAIETGNEAWTENIALSNEATKRYQTTESQIEITKNQIKDISISLGNKFLPIIKKILKKVDEWTDKFDKLSDSEQENIIKIGLMVAAAGPLLKIGSSAIGIIGNVSKGLGTFSKAISLAHNGIGSATGSAANLAKVLKALTSPAGLAAAGIATAVGIIVASMAQAEKASKEAYKNIGESASDFVKGIDIAQSHLDAFNTELFVSAEQQQQLEEQMKDVQEGITKICRTASDERRGYTQEEITQLDEYFVKLRELNERELQIQQQIAGAITQQAKTNAETFEGTLEEYKIQSQEWLKTAEEQKDKTIKLIKSQTIEEVALLNYRYQTEEERQSEAYKKEYENIMQQKENKISLANQEITKISELYASGYSERAKQNDNFYTKIQEYHEKMEAENERYEKENEKAQGNAWDRLTQNLNRHKSHEDALEKIWKETTNNMTEAEEKQLGVWLGMVAQTEMYGGEIDNETQKIVDSIISSYDSMPKGTREAMKNAMQPMLEEMQNKEPSLFAKATGIADGILSRLKKAFNINSSNESLYIPGHKTGLDYVPYDNYLARLHKGERVLTAEENKQLMQMEKMSKFNNINSSALHHSVIDKTNTIFTTPQIVFNVQELDEQKLQQCFNYINKKFGSAY